MLTRMEAGLYLVGTPIGNLADITYRAVDTLREVDGILAEDTRHSLRLLQHYEIRKPLTSCHKFNEAQRTAWVVPRMAAGEAWALITSAGMPAVSDPGSRVVRACREQDIPVWVIPGPSAATSALALSGFGGGAFHFEGFLPPKSGARRRRLEQLEAGPVPVVIYESPYRIVRLLEELAEVFGERDMALCRELTKQFEETRFGTAAELAATWGEARPRGEFALVVAPPPRRRAKPADD